MKKLDIRNELSLYNRKDQEEMDTNPEKKTDLYDALNDIASSIKTFEKLGKKNSILYEAQLEALKEENKTLKEETKDLRRDLNKQKEFIDKTMNNLIAILDQVDEIQKFAQSTGNENWIKSLNMAQKEINRKLTEIDLIEIPAMDQTFCEEVHNCVGKINDAAKAEYDIAEVRKKGYRLQGKVFRMADVVIVEEKIEGMEHN